MYVCMDKPCSWLSMIFVCRTGVVYAIAHVRGGGDGPLGQGIW